MANILAAAKSAVSKYGLSVIPIAGHDWKAGDGMDLSKKPCYVNGQGPKLFQWNAYQSRAMNEQEIGRYFGKAANIGLVCGAVSGTLEVLDFDEEGIFDEWSALMVENGYEELVSKLLIETSLRPGRRHAIYRWDGPSEAGMKLARRPATAEELADKPAEKVKGRIETRGEGQYIVCFPSTGYEIVTGGFNRIPVLTGDERGALLAGARFFHDLDDDEPGYKPSIPKNKTTDLKPGADFNSRGDWSSILEPTGWTRGYERRDLIAWVRPGKDRRQGISAMSGLGRSGQDLLRVFSTSCYPLEGATTYDKFGAYTALNHGGDYSKSAKDLASRGYGQEPTKQSKGSDLPMPAVERAERPPVFRFYSPSDLASMPPKPMLLDGLIGVQDRFMIYGLPGVGKTLIVTEFMVASAVGGTFALLFKSVRPLRVVYCTNEGKFGYPARLRACLSQNGLTFAEVQDNLRVCYDMPQLSDMKSPRAIRNFADEYEKLNPDGGDVLILDTLNKATLGSDEIDNSAAAIACDALAEIGDRLRISSGLIHHPSKAHTDPRGASAFIGDMDCILRVFKEENSPHSSMSLYKGKDIPSFDDIAFKLEAGYGSAVVRWLGSGGFAKDTEDQTALMAAVLLMRANPSREWWSLSALSRELGRDYDTCRMALQRESSKPQGLVEKRGSGESVEYRRRAV